MREPKVHTITTEIHELTHDEIVQALTDFVAKRSKLARVGKTVIEFFQDNTWEAEDLDRYWATATIEVKS